MRVSDRETLHAISSSLLKLPKPPRSRHRPNLLPYPEDAISSLSTEVLGMIFMALVEDAVDCWESHRWTYPYRWVRVLWVCRAWRFTALATPRLFWLIDFTRIPAYSIDLWVRGCGGIPLTVWLPEEGNESLHVALAIKPDLPSQVRRLGQSLSPTGSPWDDPDSFTSLHHLCIRGWSRGDASSLFSIANRYRGITTLRYCGSLPTWKWSVGMFPESLEELSLLLDNMDNLTPPEAYLTIDRLHKCLATLRNIRVLSIACERILASDIKEPIDLPHLRHLSLSVPDYDFPSILPLIPRFSRVGFFLEISPHYWTDFHDNVNSSFVASVASYMVRCESSFRHAEFTLDVRRGIIMRLEDQSDGVVQFKFTRYTADPFVSLLDTLDVSRVLSVVLEERGYMGHFDDEVQDRDRNLSAGFGRLEAVETLTVRGDIGVTARDLLMALVGDRGAALFSSPAVNVVVWESLKKVVFDRVNRSVAPGCGGKLHIFLGLIFLVWRCSKGAVPEVEVKTCSFTPFAEQWHVFIHDLDLIGKCLRIACFTTLTPS